MGNHMILCQETGANRQSASYKEKMHDQAVLADVTGEEAARKQDYGFILKAVFKERKILFFQRAICCQGRFGSHPAPNPAKLPRRDELCKDRARSGRSEVLLKLIDTGISLKAKRTKKTTPTRVFDLANSADVTFRVSLAARRGSGP